MSPPSAISDAPKSASLEAPNGKRTKKAVRPRRHITTTSSNNQHNKGSSQSQQQPEEERPRKSLIRKRPVSFGNPALGTYHGCLYTLDVVGEDFANASSSPPPPIIVESAESVEHVVAMVDVPPEQVPEGILNLARSHRPYLHHVRIVIAEYNEQYYPVECLLAPTTTTVAMPSGAGQEETKDDGSGVAGDASAEGSNINSNSNSYDYSQSNSSFHIMENAASVLAPDASEDSINVTAKNNSHDLQSAGRTTDNNYKSEMREDDNSSVPSRTYLVLLELCSKEAADGFVEDLHGKPYTSLDETQTCSVHHVLALSGENGVSLLSPFFAPSTKSTSTKVTTTTTATSSATMTATTTPAAAITAAATSTVTATTTATHTEDYNCAVCLEHMNLTETELAERSSILTTVCNHTFHLDCLLQWQDSPCPVCRYDHSGLNETLSQCHLCGTTEHNYVCLICGVVSCGGPPVRNVASATVSSSSAPGATGLSPMCGASVATSRSSNNNYNNNNESTSTIPPLETSRRLSHSHARKHYDETLHAYSLDTETQHVWDFAGQGYVHRLLQNKEDGKLVEIHNPANTSSHERSLSPGLSDAQEGEVLHRKLEGFASQYYTLLKSQLEQQRSYYQGRLEELRRESLIKKKSQTSDLTNALKQEKTQLSKRLASLRAKHAKVLEDVAFLKNMNESLESNKEPLKRKVQEAQRKRTEARDQLQECLPVLEEKVTMLMLQLTGGEAGEEDGSNGVAAAAAAAASTDENEADAECAPEPDSKALEEHKVNEAYDSKPPARS